MLRPWLASGALLLAGACTCTPSQPDKSQPSASVAGRASRLVEGDAGLRARLHQALADKGPDYRPRTKHKEADGSPRFVNRLILETSPYLLQHAHNPVHWFPWGDEAFAVAAELGRPLFLSVGYSTCHWCHVMEEESFEDEAIARYLNDHYVCIKVDREERPDVDAIYMHAVQLLGARGGWPMSVWLTPERQPFYAGTYFPARDGERGMAKGLATLLREQADAYAKSPTTVAADARGIAERIRSDLEPPPASGLPGEEALERAEAIATDKRYDPDHGGARGRPKFPSSFPVRWLLRRGARDQEGKALEQALTTLRKMQAGGIYDHVGGGFHRYAVDERWLVPHFEKMLYDSARLAVAYLEGYQLGGDADLGRVARETLDYVLREMTHPDGAFYSATDADSLTAGGEREEGYYFTWTPGEIDAVLGPERGPVVRSYYGVTDAGNFEGRNVLFTPKSRAQAAKELGMDPAAFDTTLAEARVSLRGARDKRPRPLRDDKILAGWNGMMIGALARGARVLGEPRYAEAATRAATFVLGRMLIQGRLHHSYRDGRAGARAFAEDHALLAAGLVELFQATGEARWLRAAIERMNALDEHHAADGGGYYRTSDDAEKLLAREMETRDGPVPSAASAAALTSLQLATLTGDDRFRARAERSLRAYGAILREKPWLLDDMMLALDYLGDSARQILVVLPGEMARDHAAAAPLFAVLQKRFVPNHVQVIANELALEGLSQLVPWAKGKPPKNDKPTVYVCEEGACELPTSLPAVLDEQLRSRG